MIPYCLILFIPLVFGDGPSRADEIRLKADLFRNWSGFSTRPVAGPLSETIIVHVGMTLIDITEFSEDNGQLAALFYDRMTWKDATLAWDPAEYNGITAIRIKPEGSWSPDVILFNNLDFMSSDRRKEFLRVVYSDGTVLWVPSSHHRIACSSADEGTWVCPFKWGSWTHDGHMIDVGMYNNMSSIDLADFVNSHPSWTVANSSAKYHVAYYPCCEEPYPSVMFTLELKRKDGTSATAALQGSAFLVLLATFWAVNFDH